MDQTNVELARRAYAAALSGNLDALREILDPDVRWHGGDLSAPEACHNRGQVLEFIDRARSSGNVGELIDVIDAGDKVVVIIGSPSGEDDETVLSANVTTFRNGKIIEMVHYPNPEDACAQTELAVGTQSAQVFGRAPVTTPSRGTNQERAGDQGTPENDPTRYSSEMSGPVIRLVIPDLALLDAAIHDRAALTRALNCEVADGWDVFPEALRSTRDAVAADPASTLWGTRLFLLRDPSTLVGWGGFKGSPRDGIVELGYAVAPSWEGRGLATAAVRQLVREAFAAPDVQTVVAHTLAEPGPSVQVLEKVGFLHDGEVRDADVGKAWRYRLERTG